MADIIMLKNMNTILEDLTEIINQLEYFTIDITKGELIFYEKQLGKLKRYMTKRSEMDLHTINEYTTHEYDSYRRSLYKWYFYYTNDDEELNELIEQEYYYRVLASYTEYRDSLVDNAGLK
jgi:hypothetical protein